MEYAKIATAFTNGIAFRVADPCSRGAWISLIAYCAVQRNGGLIFNCLGWGDRQWMACASLNVQDVEGACAANLAVWKDDTLHVLGYDTDAERAYLAVQKRNRKSAAARWGIHDEVPAVVHDAHRHAMHDASGHASHHVPDTDDLSNTQCMMHSDTDVMTQCPSRKEKYSLEQPDASPADRGSSVSASGSAFMGGPGQPAKEMEDTNNRRVREAVHRLGGILAIDGVDLVPQWRAAFRGRSIGDIETVFHQAVEPIKHPETFVSAVANRQAQA